MPASSRMISLITILIGVLGHTPADQDLRPWSCVRPGAPSFQKLGRRGLRATAKDRPVFGGALLDANKIDGSLYPTKEGATKSPLRSSESAVLTGLLNVCGDEELVRKYGAETDEAERKKPLYDPRALIRPRLWGINRTYSVAFVP
jgi:hypothetical protein